MSLAATRLAGLPIPQLVQFQRHAVESIQQSCRPSNSPVGTIYDEDKALAELVLPAFQFPSWYNSSSSSNTRAASLAGLPIPQLVQSVGNAQRMIQSLAGLPIPQLVQSASLAVTAQSSLAGLPIPQLVQ